MLSRDLASIRGWFDRNHLTGVQLTPAAIVVLVNNLDLAIADAEALEALYASSAGAHLTGQDRAVVDLSDIPGNVVSILDRLTPDRGSRGRYFVPVYGTRPLPEGPEGGAA